MHEDEATSMHAHAHMAWMHYCTLTFTDGVRILPRLVILAVIFTAPHYIRPAGEKEVSDGDRWQCDTYSIDN